MIFYHIILSTKTPFLMDNFFSHRGGPHLRPCMGGAGGLEDHNAQNEIQKAQSPKVRSKSRSTFQIIVYNIEPLIYTIFEQ
jgi:hypothetical protein